MSLSYRRESGNGIQGLGTLRPYDGLDITGGATGLTDAEVM